MMLRMGTPNDRQREAMLARRKYIAYGGARGGGKSWFVRTKATGLALMYPGIRILLVRRTYSEVIKNHVDMLKGTLRGVAKWNESKMEFRFGNGSLIRCGYFNAEKDAMQYQGVEYDVIFIDEATQLKEEWLRIFPPSLRGVNDFPKRIYYTCNPGGPAHGYIKRLFVDRKYETGEREEEYEFIQAKVTDNKALMEADPTYIRQLEALPPKLRAGWLEGRWDIFEGQFFEDFVDRPELYEERRFTHVIEPFEIPKQWQIYRSFDFGYGKPFSVAWWAVDYDGRLYRIMELYGCRPNEPNTGLKWEPGKIFSEIKRIEEEHRWLKGKHVLGVADPSIWDGSRGVSVADQAAKCGVYFEPGINDRIPGWMQVHYRLAFDEDGVPMMYVFRTCQAFMRTMPLLSYSATRPEDLDTTMEDHVADEVRYMCMARPIKPVVRAVKKPAEFDPLGEETRYGAYDWAQI